MNNYTFTLRAIDPDDWVRRPFWCPAPDGYYEPHADQRWTWKPHRWGFLLFGFNCVSPLLSIRWWGLWLNFERRPFGEVFVCRPFRGLQRAYLPEEKYGK